MILLPQTRPILPWLRTLLELLEISDEIIQQWQAQLRSVTIRTMVEKAA